MANVECGGLFRTPADRLCAFVATLGNTQSPTVGQDLRFFFCVLLSELRKGQSGHCLCAKSLNLSESLAWDEIPGSPFQSCS